MMATRASALTLKFGLGFFLARYLDLRILGLYGLVVGATLVLPTLFRAGLTSTLTRATVNAQPAQLVDAIQHYLLWVVGCYVAALLLLLGAQQLGFTDAGPVNLYLVWLVVFAEHLAADLGLLFCNLYKTQMANMLGLVQTAIWVLPFCGLALFYPSWRSMDVLLSFWAAGTWVAVLGFGLVLSAWPWRGRAPLRWQWYRSHLPVSAYLYLSDLTGTLAQFVDRYLIAVLIDIQHAGVYTLYFQLANAVYTLVSSSIINLHRPGVLSAFQKRNEALATALLHSLQKRALGSMVLMSLAGGLAFHGLAPLLHRPLVLQYLPLMWLTFVATGVKIACVTSFVELFGRHLDAHLFLLNVLILVLVALGSVALIPATGIYGIPLASGLTYLLVWYYIHHIVRSHTPRLV